MRYFILGKQNTEAKEGRNGDYEYFQRFLTKVDSGAKKSITGN